MQDYHQLEIWRRGMDFAVRIYEFTRRLPREEQFHLVSQLRRAATSVPFNIAEGAGCATNPEFARFLSYAYRSLKEVATGLELCLRLYPDVSEGAVTPLLDEGDQLTRMTRTLMLRLGWTGPAWQDQLRTQN